MPGKGSKVVIRDVAPKKPPRIERGPETIVVRKETAKELGPQIFPRKRAFNARFFYTAGGGFLIIAAGFFILFFFSSAEIIVTPRQEFIEISSSLGAGVDLGKEIGLESISFEDSIELEKPIEGVKKAQEKARGNIVIYNAFSTAPQLLVAQTRFEAPNGNIYRILNPVTVPGAKLEGGTLVPEGIEVTVYADKPGEEYNLGLSDFTIPGFKGSPRYEKFYARSKTEITSGFSGEAKIATKEDVDELLRRAEEDLKATLKEKIEKDLPPGVFLPEGAHEIKLTLENVNPPINSPAEILKIKVRGLIQALVLKKDDVEKSLGRSYFGLQNNEDIDINNFEALSFEISSKNFENKTMNFSVKGRAHFVWVFDAESLKKDLAQSSRSLRKEVFKNYPAIDRAEIHFKPAWWRFFPDNPERVRIEKVLRSSS